MSEHGSASVDLLRYPILVFSILLALVAAKRFLGLEFGAVTELSTGGVKFAEKNRATFEALANLEPKVNQALAELAELKKASPAMRAESAAVRASIFEASQVVSDQTARVEQIDGPKLSQKDRLKGYVWIGNYATSWEHAKLALLDTGQPVTMAPRELQPGTEYQVLGNLVVRDGLPANDQLYFKGRNGVGVVPRGTRVRITSAPTGIDREYAVQYWVEIEVLGGA